MTDYVFSTDVSDYTQLLQVVNGFETRLYEQGFSYEPDGNLFEDGTMTYNGRWFTGRLVYDDDEDQLYATFSGDGCEDALDELLDQSGFMTQDTFEDSE